MKAIQKTLFVIVIAMIAFSATTTRAYATLTPGILSISGSSTVYPVAIDASATFSSQYYNITGNTITMNIQQGGSGVAIPNMAANVYDMGELSRPPTDAEFNSMPNLQLWAIGIDSVAIVVNPHLSPWIQNVTVAQVAYLFEKNQSSGNPYYTYWNDFNAAAPHETIYRAVRDPTSGTFDCFFNFFLKPAGFDNNASKLASYTYCQNNIDVLNTINSSGGQDYIGFISLGYLHYGGLSALNIWNPLTSTYVVPSQAHVIDGTYVAWRWLWEATAGPIAANMTDPNFVEGLWVSYLRLPNGYAPGVSFLAHEDYIDLNPADMAGGPVINSTLQPETHLQPNQTQTYPDGKVDYNDIVYFVDQYINFYSKNIYNPLADFNADGKINYNDIVAFAQNYIAANSQ